MLVAGTTACQAEADAASPPAPAVGALAPVADAGPPPTTEAVTLVDAGRAPRAPLSYAPGAAEHLRAAHTLESAALGSTSATVLLDIANGPNAAGFSRTLTIADATLGTAVPQIDPTRLRALSGQHAVDAWGLRVGARVLRPTPSDLDWLAADLIVPLPRPPLGLGARWTATRVADAGTGSASYTLTASTGGQHTVTFETNWTFDGAGPIPATRRTARGTLTFTATSPTALGTIIATVSTLDGQNPVRTTLTASRP